MEEGKSGMNGESSINIYVLPCIKQTAGEKLLYRTIAHYFPKLLPPINSFKNTDPPIHNRSEK